MLNTTDKIIKHKTGFLNLAEELGNVSKACQVMHCPAGDCVAIGRKGYVVIGGALLGHGGGGVVLSRAA